MLRERIKYSVINFISFLLFWSCFYFNNNIDIPALLWVNIVVALADIAFVDGYRYGKWAYAYLFLNRVFNVSLIIIMCNIVNSFYLWICFAIYCVVLFYVIKEQWHMVDDDILCEDLEDCYRQTMYELDTILTDYQKNILEELEKVVDEDKMFIFIATFDAEDIQKLLKVELWGIAFLIQKEDFEGILKMVEKIE